MSNSCIRLCFNGSEEGQRPPRRRVSNRTFLQIFTLQLASDKFCLQLQGKGSHLFRMSS
jgi:hypothetical protein